MRLVEWSLLFLATFAMAMPAAARDIHVSNVAGDDRYTGVHSRVTSDGSGPVCSIAKALRLASQGDQIVLEDTGEPYRESVSLVGRRHSGLSFRPFAIRGNGAILDGSVPVPPGVWENVRGPVFRFPTKRQGYLQIFLDGRPAERVTQRNATLGRPELAALQWCLWDGHVYFAIDPELPKLPDDYALSYSDKAVGITLFHVERVVVVDLTVQGFHLDGISASNSAREVTLAGVTCRGNGRSGVAVGGASRAVIDACLIGNNGYAQVLALEWSETAIRNSRLLVNPAPALVDRGGRVYINGQRVRGGLKEELVPEGEPEMKQ